MPSRKVMVAIVAVVLIAIVAGALVWYAWPKSSSSLITVTCITDWSISGSHAFAFAAIAQGYYAAEGLNVIIYPGTGSSDAIQKIIAGGADFGFTVEPGAVVAAVAQGQAVKMIGSVYRDTDLAWNYLSISNITTPKDIEGKIIAGSSYDAGMVLLPAFAQINGINLSKVQVETIDSSVYRTLMFQGTVQMTPGTLDDYLTWNKTAQSQGIAARQFAFKDYGLDILGGSIITSDKMLQEKPDIVRAFLRASYKGFVWVSQHPDTATQIVMNYSPLTGDEQDVVRGAVDYLNTAFAPYLNTTAPTMAGIFDAAKVQFTDDIMSNASGITEPPVADLYTNAFLTG
jgi:NitT/TauT family transport system substrate-binding protein